MEKQRKQSESESGRRLLKKYIRFFLLSVFLFSTAAEAFSQTLTNAMLRELRISPVQDQQLAVNTDIKFEVIIPYTMPGQIDVSMPQEVENVQFKTLRKVESGEAGGGTKIELWFSFSKTGLYALSPLVVKIKNSRRQIPFMPVKIGINPKEQPPLCVVVTDSGMNKNITVGAGQKVRFRICLQYAVQLVQFSWELTKDYLFTQTKAYEFTEIKQREKVVSDELIPVSDFEWTPLVTGAMEFPKFNIQAIAYNGDKVTVRVPQIKVNVVKARSANSDKNDSYFAQAFETDAAENADEEKAFVSKDDAATLALLRSRERHSVTGKARRERIEFEKSFALPYNQKEFKLVWVYLCALVTAGLIVLLVVFIRKKKILFNMIIGIALVCMVVLFIYSTVCAGRKYGISMGGQICSIPEASASIKSGLPAGNRVQIIEESGDWYLLRFGETEGWCIKDDIIILK